MATEPHSTYCDPDFITTREAAQLLRLSPITLAQWRCRDEGPPFVRLGRAVRYRAGDVRDWAQSQTVRGSS